MDISHFLGVTYFEILNKDVLVNIFYKLLDVGTYNETREAGSAIRNKDGDAWLKFINMSYNVRLLLNDPVVINLYMKSKYPDWYAIISEEDIVPYEIQLRSELTFYELNRAYIPYVVLIYFKYNKIRHDIETLTLQQYLHEYRHIYDFELDYYSSNIFGLYLIRKTFPLLYDKIKHINLWDSINRNSFDRSEPTPQSWISGPVYSFGRVNDEELRSYMVTGKLPLNYILKETIMEDYGVFLMYILLKDPQFDLNIQDPEIISTILADLFDYSKILFNDVLSIVPISVLISIVEYYRKDILDNININNPPITETSVSKATDIYSDRYIDFILTVVKAAGLL